MRLSLRASLASQVILPALALLGACGGNGGGGSLGPCEVDPPAAQCSVECSVDSDCDGGFFCGPDGTCTAECAQDNSGCEDDDECDGRGHCVDGGNGCPDVNVDLTPITPTVVLLIDRSGSMISDSFGTFDTRWDAVADALVNPDTGVLWSVDDQIIVGASLYMSDSDMPDATCPMLESVAPAAGNAANISDLILDNAPYDENLNTPTAESITATVATFPASPNRVLVLATDGDPDTCEDPDSNGDPGPRNDSEMAVQAAFDAGIPTFVLSVGDDATATHLQRLARAGRGQDLATGTAEPYIATSPAQLVDAFGEIIRGVRTCQITVDGTVDLDQADQGQVTLNGEELTYGTDWTMQDENTLLLINDACTTFLETDNVSLDASFPCGGVVVD